MDRKQFVEDNCIEEDVLFLDPKGCVPWLASQTDMLAQDWYIVLDKY